MMNSNFQLSRQADSNKIFLTKFSELEGRFDPVMILYQKEIQNLKYPLQNLGSILKHNPQYGANEIGVDRQYQDEIQYIRITDIDNNGLLKNKLGKTAVNIENQYLLNFNDLLLARSGSIGRAYLHKQHNQKSIFAGYLIRFVIDKAKVSPDYIFSYMQLKFYKNWVGAIQRTVAQPNINAEEYKSLKIPIPPKNIQADIVAKMDTAYQDKKDKEAQAQNLLDSIDTYLLNELEIDLPKPADNSLKARMFTKKFSNITGGRFDVEYYQNKYIDFDFSLNNARYKISNIDNIITSIVSGSTPKSGGSAYQDDGEYHFIRLTNFNNSMEVDLSKSLFIKENVHYKFLKRSRLKKGDVLFGIAGSIGKIAIYSHNEKANINQAIARLRFKDNINYIYIAYLLNSSFLKYQIERNKRPVAQPNLNTEELKSLKIPLPPLEKQNQIAEHISKIRNKAKQLQTEAKTRLEQVKQKIETMILGNDK